MIRLHLIPETPAEGPAWSCAEIRLLRPYGHRSLARHLRVTAAASLPEGRLDVVVMQRGGPVGASLADIVGILREIRLRGARLIYDLDDDLLTRHPAMEAEQVVARIRPNVRFMLREADVVTVSTTSLADRLRHLNSRVVAWENALDEALIPEPAQAQGERGADIGYFGTHSHLQDLLAIVAPLEAAAAHQPQRPSIELCGLTNDPRVGALFRHGMTLSMRSPQGDYARFHAMLAQEARWGVGLAPLLAGDFNSMKSDIKMLDYAAAGIPTVVADVQPYAGLPNGEVTLRVPVEDFGAAAFSLINDRKLRQRLAEGARSYLMERRTLSVRAPVLMHIVEAALATRRGV